MTARRPPALIGVGNTWRGDDGVGLAVVRTASPRLRPWGIEIAEADGEPARLLDLWCDRPLAVVVDATRGAGPPGTVRCVDLCAADAGGLGPAGRSGSSHALGIADAARLAEALDRLPDRLVAIGIEGASFAQTDGLDLDASVADALEATVDVVVDVFARHLAEANRVKGGDRVPES